MLDRKITMINAQTVPGKLSVKERDRRYSLIREGLEEKNVDCAIVTSSNLFCISNGLPGTRLVFLFLGLK
jgi:hypothetical protein